MTTIGLYNVYGIKDESKALIHHKENICSTEGEQITDMLIDDYKIYENITGKVFACNLTNHFLLSTKTLPLFYVSVTYEIPLKTVLLYRLYFSFTIEDNITSAEQLIENPIGGKFNVDIYVNGGIKTIDHVEKFTCNDDIYKKLIEFTMADEMKELGKVMVGEIVEQMQEQYSLDDSYSTVPDEIVSLKDYDIRS
jgi:hypothetical protein